MVITSLCFAYGGGESGVEFPWWALGEPAGARVVIVIWLLSYKEKSEVLIGIFANFAV